MWSLKGRRKKECSVRNECAESMISDLSNGLSRRRFLSLAPGLLLGNALVSPFGSEQNPHVRPGEDFLIPRKGEMLPTHLIYPVDTAPAGLALKWATTAFLTFDDGPLPCTGDILNRLADEGQTATFFVIGRNLENKRLRKLAIRAVQEGHELGNHSYSHPQFSYLSARKAREEIRTTHKLIQEVIDESGVSGVRQNLFFRFPFGLPGGGASYRASAEVLVELGYRIAWWDLDTNDWRMGYAYQPRTPSTVIAAMRKARPRDIVLLHDRNRTAEILPKLLNVLVTGCITSMPLSCYSGPDSMDGTPDTTSEDGAAPEGEDFLAF
ncbi:MAG: polysaccharide deacetylase family protein [Pseudomonadota bacterium]